MCICLDVNLTVYKGNAEGIQEEPQSTRGSSACVYSS